MKKRLTYICRMAVVASAACCILLMSGCGGESENVPAEESIAEVEDSHKPADYRMPARMDSLRPKLHSHYAAVFNDSNYLQLAHAVYRGIKPIDRTGDIFRSPRPIVRIRDTRSYRLDSLTHSVPFLVPEAAALLDDIGTAFRDTLKARSLAPVRLKLTSLLRTRSSVKSLRRVNRNAVEYSTHQYGTTFDISYAGFYLDSNGAQVSSPDYTKALAEVLYDLRAADRCMVKYERKSPCFHITVI